MRRAGPETLPEDILRDIYRLAAGDYLREDNPGDGFRRCCILAGALPCWSRLSLPPAPLTQWQREDLSWEGNYAPILCSCKGSPNT